MPILNPYLNFDGGTREVVEFYQSVFGGELTVLTFGQFGMTEHEGQPLPEDGVMHAQLTTEHGMNLMAADSPQSLEQGRTPNGHISVSGQETDLLTGWFEKLAEGGTVDVPLEQAPWGDSFGQVKDRFGVNWMFNIAGS